MDYQMRHLVRMFERYGNVRVWKESGDSFLILKPGVYSHDFIEIRGTRAEVGRYISEARAIVHERGKNDTVASVRRRGDKSSSL